MIYWALGLSQLLMVVLLLARKSRASQGRAMRSALVAVLALSGLAWLWFGARDLLGAQDVPPPPGLAALDSALVEQGALLGLVQGGELQIVAPARSAGGAARLTEIGMAESVSPESRAIDLRPHEGLVLVVQGQDGGGWIYEAQIVEQAGPQLTALVRDVYRAGP
jgi:hypothetical protein